MLREILVPVDGSAFSEHALPVGIDMARRSGAVLHIVQVHEQPQVNAGLAPTALVDAGFDEEVRVQEMEALRALAARCADRGVETRTELLDGPVAVALSRYACDASIDQVIMSTHGRGGLSRVWVGSVADAVVRRASVPVMLVRPRVDDVDWDRVAQPSHVLVPLDASHMSESILEPAVRIARLAGARMTLLRVVLPLPFTSTAVIPPVFSVTAMDQTMEDAKQYLGVVADRLRADGVAVDIAVMIHPTPALAILDYASTHAVDAIAMATHGRGGWSRVALGSVADKVMRGTTMPVLLLRPGSGGIHEDTRPAVAAEETWLSLP